MRREEIGKKKYMTMEVVGNRLRRAGHVQIKSEESDKESIESRRGW